MLAKLTVLGARLLERRPGAMVAQGMAFSSRHVALWFFSAAFFVACGEKFTANDSGDAGGGSAGTANTGGTAGGAAGSSGGSTAGRGGRGGSAGSQGIGGASGAAGSSGGSDGTGSEGASGTAGAGSGGIGGIDGGGTGGTGGGGVSGSAGTGRGGSAGAAGTNGASGSGGSAGSVGTGGGGTGGTVVCGANEPRCSDGRCAKLSWTFDSGSLEGITVRTSSGQPLAVRSFQGSPALALDVSQLNAFPELSFYAPVCASGTVDLSGKTLILSVYFDGAPPSQYNFFLQVAVPDPDVPNAFLDGAGPSTGAWLEYASPFSKSPNSSAVTKFTIQVGSLGLGFTGTIWFDDIKIQ